METLELIVFLLPLEIMCDSQTLAPQLLSYELSDFISAFLFLGWVQKLAGVKLGLTEKPGMGMQWDWV